MAQLLDQLLQLPGRDRAELALALWESLSDGERSAYFNLTAADRAALERRWVQHQRTPGTAVAWDEVRRKLHAPK